MPSARVAGRGCGASPVTGRGLPATGVLNVRIAFNHLWPAAVSGELQKEKEYFGYDKWFQARLGEALVKKYTMQAKELLGSPRKRLRDGDAPHWMPKKPGPPPKFTSLLGLPSGHAPVNVSKYPKRVPGLEGKRRCALCWAISMKKGCQQVVAPSGRGKKVQTNQRLLPMGSLSPKPGSHATCAGCGSARRGASTSGTMTPAVPRAIGSWFCDELVRGPFPYFSP